MYIMECALERLHGAAPLGPHVGEETAAAGREEERDGGGGKCRAAPPAAAAAAAAASVLGSGRCLVCLGPSSSGRPAGRFVI